MTVERRPIAAGRVRAWYGLSGEIVVEGDHWHLVKLGPVPLPHPPVINRLIRRGLAPGARLRLSYLHEVGHLETLPLAAAHAVWLWRGARWRVSGSYRGRLFRAAAAFVAHEAVWEMCAEAYTMARGGAYYRAVHRRQHGAVLGLFWVGMAALALLGSFVVGGSRGRG